MYGKQLALLARERKFTLNILGVDGGNELPDAPATHWPELFSFVAQRQPSVFIFVNEWSGKIGVDGNALREALEKLKGNVGHVILLTEQPTLPDLANRQGMRDGARPPFFEDPAQRAKRLYANAIVQSFSSDWVTIIDVSRLFVDREGEIRTFTDNGLLTFQDAGHLSDAGAAMVRPMFDSAISSSMAARK
jgi:hypothetical protein